MGRLDLCLVMRGTHLSIISCIQTYHWRRSSSNLIKQKGLKSFSAISLLMEFQSVLLKAKKNHSSYAFMQISPEKCHEAVYSCDYWSDRE